MDKVRSALVELSAKRAFKSSKNKLTSPGDLPPLLPEFAREDPETIPGAQRVKEAGNHLLF